MSLLSRIKEAYTHGEPKNRFSERRIYRTVGHEVLDIEKESGALDTDYAILDDIIAEAERRIETSKEYDKSAALDILDTISSLLKEKGFRYYESSSSLLNNGLKTKKLGRTQFALLYHSIADVLNLPIKGIAHNPHYIRFRTADGEEIAWKSTNSMLVSESQLDGLVGGKEGDTTKEGVIGFYHLHVAVELYTMGRLEEAERHADKSIELSRDNERAYMAKAGILSLRDNKREAYKVLERGVACNPKSIMLHELIYTFAMELCKFDDARKYLNKWAVL